MVASLRPTFRSADEVRLRRPSLTVIARAAALFAACCAAGPARAQWATRGHIAPQLSGGGAAADRSKSGGQATPDKAASEKAAPNAARGGAAPRERLSSATAPIPRPKPKQAAQPAPPQKVLRPPPPRKPARIVSIGRRGAICESAAIRGEPLSSIAEYEGCAMAAPVRFFSVDDVSISPRAVSGCGVPQALSEWLVGHVQPAAMELLGTKVKKIHQVSAYVCRRRNGSSQGKLSFHATGDAIDIASFELADGRRVGVLEDWDGKGPTGEPGSAFLRRIWKSACGPFGTVLGPEADAAHKNHFHLDVARRRRPFCQ